MPYLPFKTELDFYIGDCYVSLVGFMFLESALNGLKIPFHKSFEEVNLRFYIRYKHQNIWRRGVVFIKEIVPKFAVTLVANTVYQEHYETLPMDHHFTTDGHTQTIEYRWKKKKWYSLSIVSDKTPCDLLEGSPEEFFTEHYWGYTQIHDHLTLEYNVDHPRWQSYKTNSFNINVDFEGVYGNDFAFLQDLQPESVFLAEGSGISLVKGNKIKE
jgi:uncharacterized protein YqjF (DUF2071 family)